eukprot:11782772-Alexandrium_andersonii.AAC.1
MVVEFAFVLLFSRIARASAPVMDIAIAPVSVRGSVIVAASGVIVVERSIVRIRVIVVVRAQ